jgi:hypothetical protein
MLILSYLPILFGLAVFATAIYLTWRKLQRAERALRDDFARQTFQTPEGHISGAGLRVVKVSKQSRPISGQRILLSDFDLGPADAFWYCVGPGPSYFLAIAILPSELGRSTVQWIVRPLTEQAMRGALTDDRKASALAFGSAIEG